MFFVGLGKIVWIDILLSGDNALVIAMACRALAPRQRMWGMILGAGAAVGMRIIFTGLISELMTMPYLKIAGGIALFYVSIKMVMQQDDEADERDPAQSLFQAIRLVVIADIVMSLDNMIAVAAAAHGDVTLIAIGLVISIPMVVSGAAIITALLHRWPLLIPAGGALLGYIAGEVIATDPAIVGYLMPNAPIVYGVGGAGLVLASWGIWRRWFARA